MAQQPEQGGSAMSRRACLRGSALSTIGVTVLQSVSAIGDAAPTGDSTLAIGPDSTAITLIVNGAERALEVKPRTTFAEALRGSHNMPLMPVPLESGVSYFDGPPIVSCAALCVRDGHLTEAQDVFAHPFWDRVRTHVADKAIEMRRQGFFGAAMLPMNELEYTGITTTLQALDARFAKRPAAAANRVVKAAATG